LNEIAVFEDFAELDFPLFRVLILFTKKAYLFKPIINWAILLSF